MTEERDSDEPRGNHGKNEPAGGTPNQCVAGGHDWSPQRKQLIDDGYNEGLRWLDEFLPKLQDEPDRTTSMQDGESEVAVPIRVLCAADILDMLRDRSRDRRILDDLRPALSRDVDTPADVGAKWQALADHAHRFEHTGDDGQQIVSLGRRDGAVPGSPGVRPPKQQWAEAFRETTRALLRHVSDALPVHALLRDLDEILTGDAASITRSMRDVDLLVREIRDRDLSAQAEVRRQAEEEGAQQEKSLMRQHVGGPAGRAILRLLLRDEEATAAALKEAALAAIEERARSNDEDRVGKRHGRTVEETLRVMRDRCWKVPGCAPCAEHLALVTTPKRGVYRLTDKGRAITEAQKQRKR